MSHPTPNDQDASDEISSRVPQSTENLSVRLSESEARYRALINSIDVGFCIIEMLFDDAGTPCDYRFLEANPAFEQNTGLSNAIGRTIREFFPDFDTFWFETYGAVAKTGEPIRVEEHASGLNRWYEIYAQRFGEPGENKVSVFFTDVSARREAEETLRQAEERERARLTDLFMVAPAFMASLRGPTHIYELANPPYLQLIGRYEPQAEESILGKTVAEVVPETVEQGFIQLLDDVYRSGKTFVGTDARFAYRKDASSPLDERFVDFTFQPLFDEEGATTGIMVHGIDLTERKRLEQERERLIEQQKQLVEDLREAGLRQRRFLKEMLSGFTEGRLRLCDTHDELPAPLAPLSDAIALTPAALRVVRKTVEAAGLGMQMPEERLADLTTAVHEASMNAVRYGIGGTARVYGDQNTGRLQIWVQDQGVGIDEESIHRAVEQGWTTGGFGQGFFLMRSCCDRLFLLTGRSGTTVVMEKDRAESLPAWIQ